MVTFPEPGEVDSKGRGIDEQQAARLRGRLARFAEGWESPEMQAVVQGEDLRSELPH